MSLPCQLLVLWCASCSWAITNNCVYWKNNFLSSFLTPRARTEYVHSFSLCVLLQWKSSLCHNDCVVQRLLSSFVALSSSAQLGTLVCLISRQTSYWTSKNLLSLRALSREQGYCCHPSNAEITHIGNLALDGTPLHAGPVPEDGGFPTHFGPASSVWLLRGTG